MRANTFIGALLFSACITTHAQWLNQPMAGAPRTAAEGCDAAVPVPLHFRRLFARGFNQSAVIARMVARSAGVPCLTGAVVRTRVTPPQAALRRREREVNLKGSFKAARPAALRGRRVLLVDDVCTTGATVAECARVLRDAGAESVRVFTLARTA